MAQFGSYNGSADITDGVITIEGQTLAQESGVALILDDGSFGLKLNNRVEANYGTPGYLSTSLLYSDDTAGIMGGTGSFAFAQGYNVEASGYAATAQGYLCKSSGSMAFAQGWNVESSGYASAGFGTDNVVSGQMGFTAGRNNDVAGWYGTAVGVGLIQNSVGTVVVGQANATYTDTSGSPNVATAPVFIVGNGTVVNNDAGVRSDALIIRQGGQVEAPSLSEAEINAGDDKILVTKEWVLAQIALIP